MVLFCPPFNIIKLLPSPFSISSRMKKILTLLFTVCLTVSFSQAQEAAPIRGLSDERDFTVAFVHANIRQNAGTLLSDATLIIRKDKIVGIGNNFEIPKGALVYDLKGRTVFPSFIDIYTNYGQPSPRAFVPERGPQYDTKVRGAYSWNQALHPEYDAYRNFVVDPKRAEAMRKSGFGLALTLEDDGIARGTASFVALGDGKEQTLILNDRSAACFSFNKGTSRQDYPASLMGSIALLRQTCIDADWYKSAKNKDYNISLESWNASSTLPRIFEVSNYLSALRAARIGSEFGIHYILKGAGDEYKRIAEIVATKEAFIIPLTFPKVTDVSNPYDAENISLSELKSWELAPTNPAVLEKAGVKFAITAYGLKDPKDFTKNLLKAIKYGLTKEAALKALTQTPAELLHVSDKVGELKTGMLACFTISNKDVFDKDNVLLEEWILGKRYIIQDADTFDRRGKFHFTADTLSGWNLQLSGEQLNPEWTLYKDSVKVKADITRDANQFTLRFEIKKGQGAYRLNAVSNPADAHHLEGEGQDPQGKWITWKADWFAAADAKKDTSKKDTLPQIGKVWYPNSAFGTPEPLVAKTVLIKNATVWTNEKEGILKETDVLIKDGKISRIGKNLDTTALKITGVEVIDGTGKHLTPGIIDEHSHIAINEGVNEGTHAITSEVRIGDVLNPDDINIYRQLAGGVTTSHLLHGSANPIGGQTALIKLRWGKSAEAMKFENADGFIKFALGENVKQANWGDDFSIRYPQTRMGVEQIYMDAFSRAKDYYAKQQAAQKMVNKNVDLPRRDLQLEALAEIINSKRFITCHSYVQSEINMLMHVADMFHFHINTFTHILEGYKVADKMKVHGAGGSTFADWWAYKYEVMEAIPYNACIMHQMGIVTAVSSDDAEMARRLNQEAAKAVKYGGVSEEEALQFVTLNPAKLLHIDQRVGSIKEGKDADLVLWNDHPLSIYAHPVKTFVDGICYFDEKRDQQLQIQNEKERQRIIRLMLDEKAAGAITQKPAITIEPEYHCNDQELLPH